MSTNFRKALENLYNQRINYNVLLIRRKEMIPRLDFDFTMAFGNLIIELTMILKTECINLEEYDYLKIGNSIQGNISEFPFSPFLKKEFLNMDYYDNTFKQILDAYSSPFIKSIDRTTQDMRIRKFRLLYLMPPIIYKFQTYFKKYAKEIDIWTQLVVPVIYNSSVHYSNFANEICVHYVNIQNDKIFDLIDFLETVEPPYEFINKSKKRLISTDLKKPIPEKTILKEDSIQTSEQKEPTLEQKTLEQPLEQTLEPMQCDFIEPMQCDFIEPMQEDSKEDSKSKSIISHNRFQRYSYKPSSNPASNPLKYVKTLVKQNQNNIHLISSTESFTNPISSTEFSTNPISSTESFTNPISSTESFTNTISSTESFTNPTTNFLTPMYKNLNLLKQPSTFKKPSPSDHLKSKSKPSRPKIPAAVRNIVWYTYISKDKSEGNCFCCKCVITLVNFEVGHVKSFANGGDSTVQNFRPLCGNCNKSMGRQNIGDFMKKYGIPGEL